MSQPLGWNAGVLVGNPWTSATRTKVTVTSSATAIPSTALANRKGLYIYNASTVNVFLGFDTTITTTNEVILFPSQGLFLSLSDQVTLYGVVASGSQVVVLWEYLGV